MFNVIDMKLLYVVLFLALLLPASGVYATDASILEPCPDDKSVPAEGKSVRTVYMTYILHGNMNYDRYVRPVIWKEFPVIYDNLLSFMDEHPQFRGQVQFSGQTFGSLMQAAPEVIAHAKAIHDRGQLNFTGTFYSEPVNVNMDGETNFRCAWLGTKIIEDNVGETDGFYLQERAYHPQLPWILNNANVSWTPVITSDGSWGPFRLRGLDGSLSVCVPITRDDFIPRVEQAPANALIAIEEDYEIPQTFSKAWERSQQFNATRKDIQIEWITVKDYIERFGLDGEKFIDHSIMAESPDRGSYSRWTADPLDIVVQDLTNRAMKDYRLANSLDALLRHCYGIKADIPLEDSMVELKHDPLVWNIERAELYPDHDKYLMRDSVTTCLSRADRLLLWAVNSDAKGWFPLYEKRRERMNALENSSILSRSVLARAVDSLARNLPKGDYDEWFFILNMEAARKACVELEVLQPSEVFDPVSGKALRSVCIPGPDVCKLQFEAELPAYGYAVVATRNSASARSLASNRPSALRTNTCCAGGEWQPGDSIENASVSLRARGDSLIVGWKGHQYTLFMDSFLIKALTHMDYGQGDAEWRPSRPYGPVRTAVSLSGLYPRLRLEWQPDYLVHVQQIYTIKEDRVDCSMTVECPHPVVIRREGMDLKRTNFRPEGLDLVVRAGRSCTLGYDIPFGISEMTPEDKIWFCPLSSCFLNFADGDGPNLAGSDGLLLCPRTGEQAFSLDASRGELTLFLGASTTSGPIREMGLSMPEPTTAVHDFEWYAEPFHGAYRHDFTLIPFDGSWKDAHIPARMREVQQNVYVRRIVPGGGDAPLSASFVEGLPDNVDISMIFSEEGRLHLRLNEREGRSCKVRLKLDGKTRTGQVGPYSIVTL